MSNQLLTPNQIASDVLAAAERAAKECNVPLNELLEAFGCWMGKFPPVIKKDEAH